MVIQIIGSFLGKVNRLFIKDFLFFYNSQFCRLIFSKTAESASEQRKRRKFYPVTVAGEAPMDAAQREVVLCGLRECAMLFSYAVADSFFAVVSGRSKHLPAACAGFGHYREVPKSYSIAVI